MIVGIILAAGASSRMGRPKALLPIGADTFVTRLAKTLRAGGVDDVLVVAGGQSDNVRQAIDEAGVAARVVENPRPEDGQLSSMLTGLTAADRPGTEAVLVALVDVPLLSETTVAAVLAAFRRLHAPIIRPSRGMRHGHPVLFAREVFGALRAADPALGANGVVRAHLHRCIDVPVEDAGAFEDIDTPGDYARLIGSASGT